MVGIIRQSVTISEGDQKGENQRSWCFEIMDRANQHALAVISEALAPQASA
jgi:hypothetical protein